MKSITSLENLMQSQEKTVNNHLTEKVDLKLVERIVNLTDVEFNNDKKKLLKQV